MLPFNTYQTDRSKKNFTHQAFSKGPEVEVDKEIKKQYVHILRRVWHH